VADWHWEPVTDDLLNGLPSDAQRRVRQLAEELTVRESMIFLDGHGFTGEPPGLRTIQQGPLMLVYLTDVRGERVVIIQVNWIGLGWEQRPTSPLEDRGPLTIPRHARIYSLLSVLLVNTRVTVHTSNQFV